MDNLLVSCGIFRYEIQALHFPFETIFIDSMLHMEPEKLCRQMDDIIHKYSDRTIILLYGDCHGRIMDYEKTYQNLFKVPGINCCEIVLGSELYRKLRRERVFFFMPEWTCRWREVFKNELKMSEKEARILMHDMHSRFVYIDTGVLAVPESDLKRISEFFKMDVEILSVGCCHIKAAVLKTAEKQ